MNIKKLTSILCVSICLMFSMFLPIHAADNVTLDFEQTDTANVLQVVLTGMENTKSVSLNLKVNGNVSFDDALTPSAQMSQAGARIDTRQASNDTLDIYVTSKNDIDTQGKIVLGTIHMRGDVNTPYILSLNKAKDGIKGVSATFAATQIPADASNLILQGTTQEITDTKKPEDPQKPDDGTQTPGNGDQVGSDDTKTINDGNASVTGKKQINGTMKLSITEVSDGKYLAMVKQSLAGISTKYKAFNVMITKDGKAITLDEDVLVHMPIPQGFDKTNLKVYDIQEYNRTEIPYTIDGNFVEFSISKLGNYVIAQQNVKSDEKAKVGTGDSTNQILYIAIIAFTIVIIAILFVLRCKEKNNNK